jgi:plastocyanin
VTAEKPTEFHFVLSKSTAKRGIIVFKFTNAGELTHDFKPCARRTSSVANSCTGRSSQMISHGKSTTLRVTVLQKGTSEYLCTMLGHAASGMKGLLHCNS